MHVFLFFVLIIITNCNPKLPSVCFLVTATNTKVICAIMCLLCGCMFQDMLYLMRHNFHILHPHHPRSQLSPHHPLLPPHVLCFLLIPRTQLFLPALFPLHTIHLVYLQSLLVLSPLLLPFKLLLLLLWRLISVSVLLLLILTTCKWLCPFLLSICIPCKPEAKVALLNRRLSWPAFRTLA